MRRAMAILMATPQRIGRRRHPPVSVRRSPVEPGLGRFPAPCIPAPRTVVYEPGTLGDRGTDPHPSGRIDGARPQ